MEAPITTNVVLVAPTHEGAALKELLTHPSNVWSFTEISMDDIERRSDVLRSAAAIVVATGPQSCAERLGRLPSNVPIIACGALPPPSIAPTAWIRRPSATVLQTLLSEALSSTRPVPRPAALPVESVPPPSRGSKWRRKSDMIVGRSLAIRQLLDALDRIASSPAPVSITGESGTGKELVARALHYSSPRASAPFIALNCAAIPENLFEAELFGYVRGAFTGAVTNRTGAFEGANNGTLFLDEIGEMPRTLQPKLLRVLERGEVTRLGSNESRKLSVRVVTATNRRLEDEVRAGNFRQDLYFRLRVCHVHIPPLRERLEDIAPLVAHHLAIISTRERRSATPRLSPAAFEKVLAHHWPGNVRELVNVLEAALLLARDNVIEPEHLQVESSAGLGSTSDAPILAYREAKARFEADYYARVLRAARGNVSLASKLTQKTRKEVYDAIRRAGLEVDTYRDDEMTEGS